MREADRRHALFCFGVLRAALGLCAMPGDDELSDECVRLFVSWHLVTDGARHLRGCIGTFEPQPLAQGSADEDRDDDEAQTRESDTGMTNGRIRAAADPAVAMS